MKITRRCLAAAVAVLCSLSSGAIAQQAYPTKQVRIVVPFPAGGTTDMLARLFAAKLQAALGQPFIVENMGGAGGAVGADNIAKSPPDGHALLFHNLTFTTTSVSLSLAGKAKHDIEKDFAPITLGANVPLIVMVPKELPTKDLKEFIAHAKAAPSALFYGSTGPGSLMNLAGEIFKRDAGIKLDHVPFRGAAPQVQELIAGRIQLGGDQLSTSLEHVRGGSLKAIATLHPTRIPLLPDVATAREQGFPNMELSGWNGFFGPAGTPQPIIEKIREIVKAATEDPETKAKMLQVGAEPVGSTPAEFKKVVLDQVEKLKPLIKDLNLVPPT